MTHGYEVRVGGHGGGWGIVGQRGDKGEKKIGTTVKHNQ